MDKPNKVAALLEHICKELELPNMKRIQSLTLVFQEYGRVELTIQMFHDERLVYAEV